MKLIFCYMEIKGIVIAKPTSDSGVSSRGEWRKAYLVVRYEDGQYPKDILLSNMKDPEAFENIAIGQRGTFRFDCEVRQAQNGRYYQDTKCWGWSLDRSSAPV